tara:strand:+ start:2293 stop:2583 length:291 start_codon:yes stop_codon:yes gene_type:complete
MQDNGLMLDVVLYLENPPTENKLRKLLDILKMKPRELLRKGEDLYKSLNLKDANKSDDEIIKIMSENPKLIERPIVTLDNEGIIGRPPENVLKLIK